MNNSALFTPYELKNLTLPNRVVMAPMTRMACENYVPGEQNAAYYRKFAENDVGLIITECTFVDHPGANAYPGAPAFYGENALAGWKSVVDAVHDAGGKIIPQIWHAGPKHSPEVGPDEGQPGFGPDEIISDGILHTRRMSQGDIDAAITAFADAAKTARELGFDGVEIHGAHSFLIDAFLWQGSNHRTDAYGGSIENRVRFAVEVVSAVRHAVGDDFLISFRFSQWKQEDYEARIAQSPEELSRYLLSLACAGVDVFHPSTRRFWEPAFDDSPLSLAAWTRKITGCPVIAVGSVGIDSPLDLSIFMGADFETHPASIDGVNEALKRSDFDLIAVGRALLGDPGWIAKISGNIDEPVSPFTRDKLASL